MPRRVSPVTAQRRRLSVLVFLALSLAAVGLMVAGIGGWHLVRANSLASAAAIHADDHRELQAKSDRLQGEQTVARQTADDAQAAYTQVFRDLEFSDDVRTDEETQSLSDQLDVAGQVQEHAEAEYSAVSRELNATNKQAAQSAAALIRTTADADRASGLGSLALLIGGPLAVAFGLVAVVLWLSRGTHDARYASEDSALTKV